MKRRIAMLVLACLIAASLAACTPDQPKEQSDKEIEQVKKSSRLSNAERILADTKAKLAKEVKPEYFESDEWKAFVDAYWEGYNQGQKQMKEPEYKDMTDIQY
jgi:glycyl-tRNA synthetase beta subunit